ncbi:helix-turn-helix domain-containing protein [Salinisphaera sp. SPP-AMP-43]|uniref:TetR/AcrR family transcriptional regulator n=1 Tax=Salinisphaera sp. SPP-AMP-43 TaxID=3121288 RepID=UPI003C6DBEF5
MTLRKNKKRARSEKEKEARRAAILVAAQEMIADTGFDGMTMSALARRAGLSKGTLYLYVHSKEELFLALFVDALETLVIRIEQEATEHNLAELMGRVPQEVPLFLPLLARLVAVIEANVADPPLFEAKRTMHGYGDRVAAVIARISGASLERASETASVLMMAMQGAAQFDITAQRDLATVPDDLKPAFASQAFSERFPMAARLILSAIL